jgi:predicted ester cyclase
MSVEENKITIHRIFEEIYGEGNLSIIPEVISPNYFFRDPPREFKGIDGYKSMVTSFLAAFPDTRYTVEDIVGEKNWTATRCILNCTFKGEIMGLAPTGKPIQIKVAYFNRFKDGKVVETIRFIDWLDFFRQAGITPPMD